MQPTSARPTAAAIVAVASALLLTGCGSVIAGSSQPANPPEAAATGAATAAAPPTGALVDCSFLTPDQVEALIGSRPAGRADTAPNGDTAGGGCTWEDQTTYRSVTIQVAAPDSAPGGTLPAWDPELGPERTLPGGMRDINGSVEFVCGGTRLCHVQVATASPGNADRTKSLALVAAVKAKLG